LNDPVSVVTQETDEKGRPIKKQVIHKKSEKLSFLEKFHDLKKDPNRFKAGYQEKMVPQIRITLLKFATKMPRVKSKVLKKLKKPYSV
jgi:hypothetical protein